MPRWPNGTRERPDLTEGPYVAYEFLGASGPFVVSVPFARIVKDGVPGNVIVYQTLLKWGVRSLSRFPDLPDGTRYSTLPDTPFPRRRTLPCPYCKADVWWPQDPVKYPLGLA